MKSLYVDKTKLVSISEFADKNKVTRQTVYNWIKEHKIKYIEIAGKLFIELP